MLAHSGPFEQRLVMEVYQNIPGLAQDGKTENVIKCFWCEELLHLDQGIVAWKRTGAIVSCLSCAEHAAMQLLGEIWFIKNIKELKSARGQNQ